MDIVPDKSSTGMEPNVAAGLAVVFGWVGGLIFFLVEKDSKFVKFWGFQAILLGVCGIVLCAIPFLNFIGIPVYLVMWVIGMINAFGGKMFKFPVIGSIAAKQAGLE